MLTKIKEPSFDQGSYCRNILLYHLSYIGNLRDVLAALIFSSGANLTRETFWIWVGDVTGNKDSFLEPFWVSLIVATEITLIYWQKWIKPCQMALAGISQATFFLF